MLLLSKVFNGKPFLLTSIKSLLQLSNDTHTTMFYPFKLDSQDILSMQLSLAKRNTMLIEFCEITLSKDVAILFIKPVIASPSCHARHYYIRHVIQTQVTHQKHTLSHTAHMASVPSQYNVVYLFSYYSIRFSTPDVDYNRNTSHNLHQIPHCHETVINCCSSRTI